MVPGKRNGWSVAGGTHDSDGVWFEGGGCCAPNACDRSFASTDRLWLQRSRDSYLSGVGSGSAGTVLRLRRCAVITSLHREYSGRDGRRQLQISCHELEHGTTDQGNTRRLRLGSGTQTIGQETMAFVR